MGLLKEYYHEEISHGGNNIIEYIRGFHNKDNNSIIDTLKQIIIDITNCPSDFCITKQRYRDIVDARHIYAYILHYLYPKMTLYKIGDITGKRHYSSVIHSISIISDLQQTDNDIKVKIDKILFNINQYKQ
jgi:chromosomal replication initiation ATPase DnaA